MKNNHQITGNYHVNHTTFGGLIYASDFETDRRGRNQTAGSTIAQRILFDWNFDEQCRKNEESRERNRIYEEGRAD